MKIGGKNGDFQLGEPSNKEDVYGDPCIHPPCESRLNIPKVLSFSVYSLHSVWIDNDCKAYAVGYNGDGSILGSLPKQTFKSEKEITFNDKNGKKCKFLSAVCGWYYTLYLVMGHNGEPNQLAYNYCNQTPAPLFLNLNGRNPTKLFGGHKVSAAIDTEGSILIFTEDIFQNPEKAIEPFQLPGDLVPIKVGCCDTRIIALASNNEVFELDLSVAEKDRKFQRLMELDRIKIIDISGTFEHAFAVCEDGRVFCRGLNDFGQLGIGRGHGKIDEFTEIPIPKKYKIVAAFAGYEHSLFLTESGMVLACGYNICGELLLYSEPSENRVYTPAETSITKDTTFCIAGNCISAVFNGVAPPPNTPNMK